MRGVPDWVAVADPVLSPWAGRLAWTWDAAAADVAGVSASSPVAAWCVALWAMAEARAACLSDDERPGALVRWCAAAWDESEALPPRSVGRAAAVVLATVWEVMAEGGTPRDAVGRVGVLNDAE